MSDDPIITYLTKVEKKNNEIVALIPKLQETEIELRRKGSSLSEAYAQRIIQIQTSLETIKTIEKQIDDSKADFQDLRGQIGTPLAEDATLQEIEDYKNKVIQLDELTKQIKVWQEEIKQQFQNIKEAGNTFEKEVGKIYRGILKAEDYSVNANMAEQALRGQRALIDREKNRYTADLEAEERALQIQKTALEEQKVRLQREQVRYRQEQEALESRGNIARTDAEEIESQRILGETIAKSRLQQKILEVEELKLEAQESQILALQLRADAEAAAAGRGGVFTEAAAAQTAEAAEAEAAAAEAEAAAAAEADSLQQQIDESPENLKLFAQREQTKLEREAENLFNQLYLENQARRRGAEGGGAEAGARTAAEPAAAGGGEGTFSQKLGRRAGAAEEEARRAAEEEARRAAEAVAGSKAKRGAGGGAVQRVAAEAEAKRGAGGGGASREADVNRFSLDYFTRTQGNELGADDIGDDQLSPIKLKKKKKPSSPLKKKKKPSSPLKKKKKSSLKKKKKKSKKQ